ncbi:alpha-ketoglutarate-dependent dioxygenase AlkB [Synechococcus sp. CS-1328]|uniref:alpha-ketoglutarate-dependent dioxygenase AlkB n=1 Tax=Synechococcus sp. CS-1328 TaxID=2847976 RepID=UPI00223A736E|nr:alpha-ketoglutarate-dependent dioxygenase AlkB [Synechococcus sp. CS-1328]
MTHFESALGLEARPLFAQRWEEGWAKPLQQWRDKLLAPIASLSLGAARSFRLKPKTPGLHHGDPLAYELGDGDLLSMDPPTQAGWLHQVPPRLRVKEERINLTFRVIRPEAIRHV